MTTIPSADLSTPLTFLFGRNEVERRLALSFLCSTRDGAARAGQLLVGAAIHWIDALPAMDGIPLSVALSLADDDRRAEFVVRHFAPVAERIASLEQRLESMYAGQFVALIEDEIDAYDQRRAVLSALILAEFSFFVRPHLDRLTLLGRQALDGVEAVAREATDAHMADGGLIDESTSDGYYFTVLRVDPLAIAMVVLLAKYEVPLGMSVLARFADAHDLDMPHSAVLLYVDAWIGILAPGPFT